MELFPTHKRRDERFPILAHLRYRLLWSPEGDPAEPELHNGNNVLWNISRTGLFLATKNYIDVKSLIEWEFPLDDLKATLKGEAEIVRANHHNHPYLGKYEYGLCFTKMGEEATLVLENFITLIDRKKP